MIIFNFEAHLLFAILFILAISNQIIHLQFVAVIGCLLSFYLPDIDHMGSKPGRALKPLSWIINLICGHRGITHSLLACLLVTALSAGLGNEHFSYGVLIGYGSHLLTDACTPQGIPLFWPLPNRIRIPILYKFVFLTKIGLALILMYLIMLKPSV